MDNRQFTFSLFVGLMLVCLGLLISTKASIGVALMTLGAAIIAIAALTKIMANNANNEMLTAPIPRKINNQ